jgi:hypothetical protein
MSALEASKQPVGKARKRSHQIGIRALLDRRLQWS